MIGGYDGERYFNDVHMLSLERFHHVLAAHPLCHTKAETQPPKGQPDEGEEEEEESSRRGEDYCSPIGDDEYSSFRAPLAVPFLL